MRETFINKTKGYRYGDSDWYEAFTDNRGRLFSSLRREYGGCVSKMYREQKDGPDIQCGWIFKKRVKYEDARGNDPEQDYYVREVWVEVSTVKPERIPTHYVGAQSPWASVA
jgi:hypothetical protein